MTGFVIVIAAVGTTVAVYSTVVLLAARAVTLGSSSRIGFRRIADHSVQFRADRRTLLKGRYGFRFAGGHAKIGPVTGVNGRWVTRSLDQQSGEMPAKGVGEWVRDVYLSPGDLDAPFIEISISTELGHCPAWVVGEVRNRVIDTWVIHLHGIRTTRSVVLPGVAALLGMPVISLIPAWRGDGEGPPVWGGGSSLGLTEVSDVERALEFARSRGAKRIVLVGWSLGGTIAHLLVRRLSDATDISGLVLIAPVTSWRAVIDHAAKRARLPQAITKGVEWVLSTSTICRLAGIASPVDLQALELSDRPERSIPTLLIHNPADELVPHDLVREYVSVNAGWTDMRVFDDAPHAMEWNQSPARFESELREWFERKVLGPNSN